MALHSMLLRQLRRLGLNAEKRPDTSEQWRDLLVRVSQAYTEADQERALLSRSQDLAWREIEDVYQRLSEAQSIAGLGNWVLDLCENSLQWSEECQRIFGLGDASLSVSYANLLACMYPEDRESFDAGVRIALAQRSEFEAEIRVDAEHGKRRWVHAKAKVVPSPQGKACQLRGTFMEITKRKENEETIWRQANFDPLTELPNRRMFHDRVTQEFGNSQRSGLSTALFLIDLDHFKEVNDTLGHPAGDMLLKEAAQRITSCVRSTDTVARLGGDEFVISLPSVRGHGCVEDIAQKIISRLAEPFFLSNEMIYISASVGITLYPQDAEDIDALMKNADQAMYAAKKRGRNRFHYFTPSLQEHAQARLRLISDLRAGLPSDQFVLYFQPIIELSTGRVRKAEALLRWQHPVQGLLHPGSFIKFAEETGLVNKIGDWVFKESARWAKHWSARFGDGFQISLNKSPVQFGAEGALLSILWLEHLDDLGLAGKNLVIEITESVLLNADPSVIAKLAELQSAGIQVAIDDFGTGYSSLSYLKKFDIDYLKIDKSFVQNIEVDANDMALCDAIIVMAHKLGLRVIAEGVETSGQRKLLEAARCDYAQGMFFSPPVPAEQFERTILDVLEST